MSLPIVETFGLRSGFVNGNIRRMEHPLTRYRRDQKLTLEAFGALVGASKSTVLKWERGAMPRRGACERIFAVTGGRLRRTDFARGASTEAA